MKLKSFGLTGSPLGHSLSPFIHSRLMELCGVNGSYCLYEAERGKLAAYYENTLKELDGFNVTIPFKTEIIPLLDSLSEEARLMGTVNTVAVKEKQ